MLKTKYQNAHGYLATIFACVLFLALSGCGTNVLSGGSTGTLVISPNPVAFGDVSVGQTLDATFSLVNGNSTPVQITQLNLTGESFSVVGTSTLPVTIPAGGTSSLSVRFSPAAAGAATGQLTITSNSPANGTAVIALSGTGTAATGVSAALSALSCSSASITGSGTDACTVTLSAAAPSGGLSISLSSSSAAVTVPATVTVPANATSAAFTATVLSVTTAQTSTLTATAGSASENFTLQLNVASSTTVPSLTINANSVAFGNVAVNTASTQSVTLTSSGTGSVTVSAAAVTGIGFAVSGTTFPVTLASGQTAALDVQFDPTTAGAATGQLTITNNSSTNSTAVITLSGTGTAGSYAVNLSWEAPTSSADPVAGYNVYRAPSNTTTYALLNSSPETETAYVDSTVVSGQIYDYIAESVDASGVESSPSNIFSVAIP